ncbi:diphthamide synthesis protein [Candidatus Woesearchaeota archaeon]|nr:diphthamide synthesis protein [Candidatus Woesearchaeota archaeon]
MEYDLELLKAAAIIRKEKAKLVVVQVPDGLKPKTQEIADYLREHTAAEIIIWAGSCFGACDTPLGLEKFGVDLLIQWGHSPWKYVFGNPHEESLMISR